MSLTDVDIYTVRIPMTMRFRRVTWREAVLLHGALGWGEFSPFPDYPPETTSRWLASALEAACVPRPAPVRDRIPVNVTIPAVGPERAAALTLSSGATTAKVKVGEPGEGEAEDVARVEAVRGALGPKGKVRVDVNGAWTVEEAEARLGRLDEFDLEYAEQPVAGVEAMAELRRRVRVPLAADESVRLSDDPLRVVEERAADLLVLKVQPLGGVERTLDLARRCGLPVVVSSALETSVGLAAGVAAAAALEELPYACGLGTATLLEGDVTFDPLRPKEGWLAVRAVEADLELVKEWRADRETESRLMRRLREAAELLT